MLLSPFTGSRPPNLSQFVTRRCFAAHPAELWRGAFINSSPFLPMFAVGDDPSFPGLLRWLLCTFAGLPIDLRNSSFINSSPFWPMFCSLSVVRVSSGRLCGTAPSSIQAPYLPMVQVIFWVFLFGLDVLCRGFGRTRWATTRRDPCEQRRGTPENASQRTQEMAGSKVGSKELLISQD